MRVFHYLYTDALNPVPNGFAAISLRKHIVAQYRENTRELNSSRNVACVGPTTYNNPARTYVFYVYQNNNNNNKKNVTYLYLNIASKKN